MTASIFSALFWRDAAERAIATAAQSAVALLSVDGLGLVEVDWTTTASVSGLAALVSVLKSVVASRSGDGSASLVSASPARHRAS